MTREKAIRMALKIIKTCNKYGATSSCGQCPFNIKGRCMVSGGSDAPTIWLLSETLNAWSNLGEEVKK